MLELRKATVDDIPMLKRFFDVVVNHMEKDGICLRNEDYPVDRFDAEIADGRLMLLEVPGDRRIVAAFSLCRHVSDGDDAQWTEQSEKTLYMDRLGVWPEEDRTYSMLRHETVRHAAHLASEMGAEYLRVLVPHGNMPVIRLLVYSGFRVTEDVAVKDGWLRKHGFEMKVASNEE